MMVSVYQGENAGVSAFSGAFPVEIEPSVSAVSNVLRRPGRHAKRESSVRRVDSCMKTICRDAQETLEHRITLKTEAVYDIEQFLLRCDSPVEQILVAALCDAMDLTYNQYYKRLQALLYGPGYDGIFLLGLEVQKPIPATPPSHTTYRADIYLYLSRYWRDAEAQPIWARTVIEVDGHDFHEKTKEQASRDRKREREFIRQGYKVIRYTGSDVFRHPEDCAEEIDSLIDIAAHETFRSYLDTGRLTELIVGPKQ